MKKNLMYFWLLTFYLFVSCSKDSVIDEVKNVPVQNSSSISADNDVVQRILKLGFSLKDIKELDDSYLVEGDIVFLKNPENKQTDTFSESTKRNKQRRYDNIVTRKGISVYLKMVGTYGPEFSHSDAVDQALDIALTKYNDIESSLRFVRVNTAADADIVITNENVDPNNPNSNAIGSSHFPFSWGAPGNSIAIDENEMEWRNITSIVNFTFVIMHELGHTIGLTHTDDTTFGTLISGTPTSDGYSIMNSEGGASTTTFSANDIIAIQKLYPSDVKCSFDLGSSADRVRKLDWDGDGYDDLFFVRPGVKTVFLNECNHNGKFSTVMMSSNGIGNFDYNTTGDWETVLDYDGDGKDDIMCYRPGPGLGKVFLLKSNGDKTFINIFANNNGLSGYDFGSTNDRIIALDYNGDGKDDIICYRPGYNIVYLMRSEGNGTFTVVNTWRSGIAGFNFTYATDKIISLDYNGDGIDEIMCYHPGQKVAFFLKPTGAGGFLLDKSYMNGFCTYDLASPNDIAYTMDYDGDGKDDVMLTRPGSKIVYIMKSLSDGNFSLNYSSGNGIIGFDFNSTSDRVVVLDYNHDGKSDIVIYRPGSGIAYSAHSNGSSFVRDWPSI